VKRVDLHAISIFILSMIELAYLLVTLSFLPEEATPINGTAIFPEARPPSELPELPKLTWERAVAYSSKRIACLVILLAIRLVVCSTSILESAARLCEWGLAITSAVIASLLFFSYEEMPAHFVSDEPIGIDTIIPRDYPAAGLSRNMPRLLAFPVYFMAITAYKTRFIPSFTYIVAAIAIVILESHEIHHLAREEDFYLLPCCTDKYYFLCFNALRVMYAYQEERLVRQQFSSGESVKQALERVERILDTLLPPMVVEQIRDAPNAELPSHRYECATIAQSDLCGFTELASSRDPSEVVNFISEIFGGFDDLTERYAIYKVETVGDAYIAGQAEAPLTHMNSPLRVLTFAWGMVLETRRWSAMKGWNVSCRVGVTTGSCTGGVVGTKMQRYHLFGQIMNELEVMESTAPRGQVQISSSCAEAAQLEGCETFTFRLRHEEFLLTSKGDKHTYSEVGGPTYLLELSGLLSGLPEPEDLR